MGSKIEFFVTDTNTTLVSNIPAVIVNPELDTSTHLDLPQCRNIGEVKYGSLKVIEPSSSSPFTRALFKKYMSTKTMYGVSGREIKDNVDEYGMPVGLTDEPEKAWNWVLYLFCPWNSADVTAQLHYKIRITYYCVFKQLNLTPYI